MHLSTIANSTGKWHKTWSISDRSFLYKHCYWITKGGEGHITRVFKTKHLDHLVRVSEVLGKELVHAGGCQLCKLKAASELT